MTSDPNAEIQRNTVEARQATNRPTTYYVVIAGIVLVAIAFAIVWLSSR